MKTSVHLTRARNSSTFYTQPSNKT